MLASTATAAPTPDSVHFTAAGDYNSTANTSAVLNAIAGSGSDLNIALGDMSYGVTGAEQAWCDFVTSRVGSGFPFELISGNHESNGQNGNINDFSACLPNQLPGAVGTYGRQYYVDVPQEDPLVRFVMISPNLPFSDGTWNYTAGSARYNWTAAAIDGARASDVPWVVVSMHKPCLSMGEYACEPGADITNLLVQKKVDVVLTGHEHIYQRTKQLGLKSGCTSLTIGSYNSSCVVDSDNNLAAGAGTVFVTTGTGGVTQRDVNAADPEAAYFAAAAGANSNQTFGFSDFVVNRESMSVRFLRAAGGTFADLFTLTLGPPPANQPPTASFTSSAAGLTASVNATASSDSDGTIASYRWAFGDGDTTTLPTPQTQHTYAAAGTYDVTLTVTDDDGDTDVITHPVTVTQTQVLASDLFARTLSRSWGSADVGGPWTVSTAVDISGVDSGEAWMAMTAPAKGPAAYLPGPTSTDLDLQLDLRLDKVPAGGSRVDQSVILRRNTNGDYRAMVRVLANGSIRAGFARTSATGVQTVFGPDITIPGLTYAAGETLKVRAQATGTSPTTVRVKVWKSTANEPAAWTATATDSTAGLQALGSIGLHVYLGSSATNAPIKARYDNLRAVVASTLP